LSINASVRYALAAPFSPLYAAKKRWLEAAPQWESLGIAQADMRRKTYVVPETGAVCITVSKCANTTLKFMLGPAEMTVPRHVHGRDHLLTRLIDRGLTLNDLLDGSHKVFTFARHPVSRFWSGYFTMVESSKRGGRFKARIRADIASAMNVPIDARFPPELVLEYIGATPPIDIDEHLRPQWSCTGIEKLVHVIGGGLAGSEAAWQIAGAACRCPARDAAATQMTAAHKTGRLAELVCSNSFRSDDAGPTPSGSCTRSCAEPARSSCAGDANQVPAGGALAVDRDGFSDRRDRSPRRHPLIAIERGESPACRPTIGTARSSPPGRSPRPRSPDAIARSPARTRSPSSTRSRRSSISIRSTWTSPGSSRATTSPGPAAPAPTTSTAR
jgi:hypothetical protein